MPPDESDDNESSPPEETSEGNGEGSGSDGERPRGRRRRNPLADPVRVHREYVQQRLAGGGLPTPEAYERALDQWQKLPGAVRGPVGEVHPEAERRTTDSESAEEELTAEASEDDQPERYDGPLPATDPGDNSAYEGRDR